MANVLSKINVNQLLQRNLPLLLVLAMAASLRLFFATGINGTDPLLYAESAWQLAHGDWPFELLSGARRIGFYLPLGLLYLLFGAGEMVTIAWTLGTSLATVWLVYAIGSLLAGKRAGLIAAFLWSLNPLSILAATSGLPDGVMAMFAAAAVYFYLLGKHNKLQKIFAYGLSALCIFYGFWVKEHIVYVGIFLVLWWLAEKHLVSPKKSAAILQQTKRFLFPGFAILLLVILVYGSLQKYSFPEALASTANDLFLSAFFHQLQVVFAPLLLGAIFFAIYKHWEESYFLIAWFAVTAVFYEWAPNTFSLTMYAPNTLLTSPRNILFLLPPLAVLGGLVIDRVLGRKVSESLIVAPCLTVMALLGLTQAHILAPESALIFSVAVGGAMVFIFGLLVAPLQMPKLKKTAAAPVLLLTALGISVISPLSIVWGGGSAPVLELRNLQKAVETVKEYPDYKVFFFPDEDPRLIRLFNYYSGFQFSQDVANPVSGGLGLADPAVHLRENGLIVDVLGKHDGEAHPTWLLVEQIQQPASLYVPHPASLKIYRALDQQTAQSTLDSAKEKLSNSPNDPGILAEILGAAINAGQPLDAIESFLALRNSGFAVPEQERMIADLVNWYLDNNPDHVIQNQIINGSFNSGLEGWDVAEAENAGVLLDLVQDDESALQLSNPKDIELIPISQHLALRPNTVYVFEMNAIWDSNDLTLLYWWALGDEGYISAIDVDGEIRLRHVFITPDWPDSQEALLAPVVFLGEGVVEISKIRIYEFSLPGDN